MASSFTWNSGSIGAWTSSSNWSSGGPPGSGDIAFLTTKGTAEVSNVSTSVAGVDINSATMTLVLSDSTTSPTLGGTLNVSGGGVTLAAGQLLVNAASSDLITNTFTHAGKGALTLSNGTLDITGNAGFAVSTTGITDAFKGGVFIVGGNLTQASTGSDLTWTDSGATTTISGLTSFNAGNANSFGSTTTSGNSSALQDGLSLATSGTELTLNKGTVSVTNGVTLAASTTLIAAGGTLSATDTKGIVDGGVITGVGLISGSGMISSTGTIVASEGTAGNTLEIGDSIASGVIVNIASTSAASILKLDGAVASDKVTFASTTAGVLELNDYTSTGNTLNFNSATIASLGTLGTGHSDLINIQGVAITGVSDISNVLTISDGSGAITTITLTTPGSTKAAYALDSSLSSPTGLGGYDVFLVCYAAGTHIQTPDGDVAVEDLAEGDSVVVLDGDRHVPTPVKWIGHRRLDLTAHPRPDMVAPVRIRRGAFAENMPRRDLFVSPDHCMFVDGKLIPAKLLINDMTIVQERDTSVVEYYHVELDRHAVLLAEGLPAESYLDTGNRAFFSNAGLALVLHPEFHVNAGLRCWETDACAPLAVGAEAVEPIWRDLAARAESLGYARPEIATTDDADLRLVANGRTIRPVATNGGRYVFVLPPGASAVRLASRAGTPSDVVPYLEDWRRLGVAVTRIVVRSSAEQTELPADHPGLTQGWHAAEHEGAALWRWTDGNARLPIEASAEPLTVEVHVRQTMQYRLEVAEPQRLVA